MCIIILFSLIVAGCNKEDFYEKKYLSNPKISDPTITDPVIDEDNSTEDTDESEDNEDSDGEGDGGSNEESQCGNNLNNQVPGSKCRVETFYQASEESKKMDIVWIIDNSGSMFNEQQALGNNFSAFIDEFITKNVDFKMGITTTDTRPELRGYMWPESDVLLTSEKAKLDEVKFKEDFKSLINVGVGGYGIEKGLLASEWFMKNHAKTFLREEAYLSVVIVSDEPDQSYEDLGGIWGVPGNLKPVVYFTDYLKSLKSNPGLVKIYSIVSPMEIASADRYVQASNLTGGLVGSIEGDFHLLLNDISNALINLLDSFALSGQPEPETIKVFVNGSESTYFTYDEISRSIKFHSEHVPAVGSEIKIFYETYK